MTGSDSDHDDRGMISESPSLRLTVTSLARCRLGALPLGLTWTRDSLAAPDRRRFRVRIRAPEPSEPGSPPSQPAGLGRFLTRHVQNLQITVTDSSTDDHDPIRQGQVHCAIRVRVMTRMSSPAEDMSVTAGGLLFQEEYT